MSGVSERGIQVAKIGEILAITPSGDATFSARLSGFGAETVGCAVRAAVGTVSGKALHALHACFVRPVPTDRPSEFAVSVLSDGRRFARRRVEARDGDRVLFDATLSFAAPGEGAAFLEVPRDPETPAPEALPSFEEVMRSEGWEDDDDGQPVDWRWIGRPWEPEEDATSVYRAWVRPMLPLPADDHGLHAGAIAYLADYHSHWPVARRLGGFFDASLYTSLDQSIWYHQPPLWDDWCLLTSRAVVAEGGRSLGHRTLHDRAGRLLATMAQEALVPRPDAAT